MTHTHGQSVLEVIVAIGIFALMGSAVTSMLLGGIIAIGQSGDESEATTYVREALEAIRSIRDGAWNEIIYPTAQVALSAGEWVLVNNPAPQVIGKYSRATTFLDVCRDASNIIVTCGSGGDTLDVHSKQVRVSASWDTQPGVTNTISESMYLTNWDSREWTEDTTAHFSDGVFTNTASSPSLGDGDGAVILEPTTGPAESMMAYTKGATDATPYYRIWNGASWGSELSATAVSAPIQYLVLKFSHTRNEAILGTLDGPGNIRVQVWNGSTWGATTLLANIGTTNDAFRGFDIAYETNGDRAVVVYNNVNSVDPAYRIWDGSIWSSATSITAPPTTGAPLWIELERNPLSSSNEIAMMLLDANTDVYGMVWTGSAWSTMGVATVWDATASLSTRKGIDVAYEQTSGRAMFLWADSVATDQSYRIWNGTSLNGPTLLDIPAMGVGHWVQLVSDSSSGSNRIMYGVQDSLADLNTRLWNGSAWDTATQHPEHDASVEDILDRNFDIVFETALANAGRAWIVWGDGATVSRRQWSGSSWGSITTTGDDTAYITIFANPLNGDVFTLAYQDSTSATDDILESHLTGGGSTWSASAIMWAGATVANPVMERVAVASKRIPSTSAYSSTGMYQSNNFDTGASRPFHVISWTASKTDSGCGVCIMRVQIQTSANGTIWSPTWAGPDGEGDGDETDFYTVSTGQLIHIDHNGDRWIRYRATLDGNIIATPIFEEIKINYRN